MPKRQLEYTFTVTDVELSRGYAVATIADEVRCVVFARLPESVLGVQILPERLQGVERLAPVLGLHSEAGHHELVLVV